MLSNFPSRRETEGQLLKVNFKWAIFRWWYVLIIQITKEYSKNSHSHSVPQWFSLCSPPIQTESPPLFHTQLTTFVCVL